MSKQTIDDKADRSARKLVATWIGGSNDALRESIAKHFRRYETKIRKLQQRHEDEIQP